MEKNENNLSSAGSNFIKWFIIVGSVVVVLGIVVGLSNMNSSPVGSSAPDTYSSYSTTSGSYSTYSTTKGYSEYSSSMNDWYSDQASGKDYSSSDGGVYYCMGKNDTCPNRTYNAYDLYCSSCDPDGDNVEG